MIFRGGGTVVLLFKVHANQHIEMELNLDEMDLATAESKATYDEIKAYVLEKHSLKVSRFVYLPSQAEMWAR